MQNNDNIQTGYLQVSVFAESVGLPVDNANVVITPTENKNEIIYDLSTNASGQTDTFDLPAPLVDFSLQPFSNVQPYSLYDVKVTADGFIPANIEAVQILPDTRALQNVRLNPIVNNVTAPENVLISPHTLWKQYPPKIPEDSVKPLPPSLGLVVLPDPVIPEFVVVHDGVPDDTSATNFYVPYKEYIKNVACCEIYSTWPLEAMEANILAINSFTLNRIYTEWYRGKGFNFTITNSTAYDQAYVHDRNIFTEISDIVDYLFTTFVTKPDIRQPLFTQYCDGKYTSCPEWLSQWGSKGLGDQGLDAVQILRNYYGQEIFLMAGNKVSGVPVSFPGTPLQVGSTGENVRTIQNQLNTISNNYPAIKKVKENGVYDEATREAVETFQTIFDLSPSGIVDFATWYKISDIYVAVAELAQL